jgi:hypothetical protein
MEENKYATCEDAGCHAYRHGSDIPCEVISGMCGHRLLSGFGCTEPEGHKGPHVACCNGSWGALNHTPCKHIIWER